MGCAVLIDYENVAFGCRPPSRLKPLPVMEAILTVARRFGALQVVQAYANWDRQPPGTQGRLAAMGIETVFEPTLENSADVRIATDLGKLLGEGAVHTIILVSGDRDFHGSVVAARNAGKRVMVWALEGAASGMLARQAPFHTLEEVFRDAQREADEQPCDITPFTVFAQDAEPGAVAETGPVITSYTDLSTYSQCPRKYYFRRIQRLPEPTNPALFVGALVHAVLAEYFRYPAEVRRDPQAAFGRLGRRLRERWANDPAGRRQAFRGDRRMEAEWGNRAMAMLRNFLATVSPDLEPGGVEQFLEWPVSEQLLLRGKVDRLDPTGGGGYRIVDYKSGRIPETEASVAADRQAPLYKGMVEACTGRPVTSVHLIYLQGPHEITLRPADGDVAAAIQYVAETVAAIQADTAFEPRPSKRCRWCGYLEVCPAREQARALAETGEPDDLPF